MEVSGKLDGMAALILGDGHGTHSLGSWVGPIVGLKAMGKQKYFSLPGKTQFFGPTFCSLVTTPNVLSRFTCLLTGLRFFKVSRKKTVRTRGEHRSCDERIQNFSCKSWQAVDQLRHKRS